jgi:hypothetical protein
MRKLLVVSFLLGLGACGGGSGLEKEMKDWKEKICKCADKDCADKTWDEYRAWQKTKRDAAKELSKADLEKLGGIENDAKACRNKLREAAGGDKPADPAAAPAAPPTEGAAPAAPAAPAP